MLGPDSGGASVISKGWFAAASESELLCVQAVAATARPNIAAIISIRVMGLLSRARTVQAGMNKGVDLLVQVGP